jgi:outer membrane protein assembly factor BamD (BamD/ComL family)
VSSLSPELDVLDRARHALAVHDPVAARAALDEYQRRFPRGSLREEAELASIESLVLAGDSAGTREAAARFLAAHPDSAYAGRVRAIVKRASNP